MKFKIIYLALALVLIFSMAAAIVPVELASTQSPSNTPEDFTTYTEIDPENGVTVTPLEVSFSGVNFRGTDTYVYSDKGINHFDGDFEHLLTAQISSIGTYALPIVWMLANTVDNKRGMLDSNEDFLLLEFYQTQLRIQECVNGIEYEDVWTAASVGTTYYVKLVRDESVGSYGRLYCYIYSDSGRTILLKTLQLDLREKEDFRYIYALNTDNDGQTYRASGFIRDLNLNSLESEVWVCPSGDCGHPGAQYSTVTAGITNVASGGTVHVAAGTYYENITINKEVTIVGAGEGNTFIDGGGLDTVLSIDGAYTIDLSGMTIQNGNTIVDYGVGGIHNNGGTLTMTNCTISGNTASVGIINVAGGIYNNGTLEMTSCTVSGNIVGDVATAGIYNKGALTMTDCVVSGNMAALFPIGSVASGGGIGNDRGTLTMTNCTVSGNAASFGGGISNYGMLTMENCTVSSNIAEYGGGILNWDATITMENSTVSGNTANFHGGGILNWDGTITMENCTVSGNIGIGIVNGDATEPPTEPPFLTRGTMTITNCTVSGNGGGGIYVRYGDNTLINSIVYGNTAYDINVVSGSVEYTDCIVGDQGDPDSLLGPLQNNGGITETHALLPGSPAIDGCITECTVTTDQRGIFRPQGDYCDIGSYEVEVPNNPPNQPSNISPGIDATGVSLTPTLTSSPFSDPDARDALAQSQWQITQTSGDYGDPMVYDNTDIPGYTYTAVSSGYLSPSTVYYWRVRYRDNNGAWSEYSDETSFTTAGAPPTTARPCFKRQQPMAHLWTPTLIPFVISETAIW